MNTVFTLFADNLDRLPEHILTALPQPYFQDKNRIRITVENNFRLPENIKQELNQLSIDYAVLPDMAFSDLGLIVSDMDSTLITIECIDQEREKAHGQKEIFTKMMFIFLVMKLDSLC